MDGAAKKTSFTYELTEDQQELLLGIMVNGNFRRREVPFSLYSVVGDLNVVIPKMIKAIKG